MPISVSRVKQLWPWLVEARFAWLALGVISAALIVSLRPHTPEPVIRLTGLVLQLLGIATVIWGISETRALFGHPSFAAKAKSWVERFPLRRRNVVIAAGAASLSAATCKARGYATQGAGQNPTIDTRLDALERNISLIHERISSTEKEMDEKFRKTAEALKNEERARQAEDNAIRAKLEATGTGGVHISAIGASWLFVGVVLSTAGVEIAGLLK
ncbi:hypothetical protein [Aromatoleum anaerobium]|uniref:Uncharacterized protein n=1 Tax=Aromatoleum anaerobium TaxID=182180 RepID=A0ABX1PJT2_9RHOO|nr:hypothetical protein [Aromatoleum anaerobium]MCK0507621.1 hypothetical protein [Aromatoleum anaerobium]